MAQINWEKISKNPLMYQSKLHPNVQVTIGQNPDGKYDAWLQHDDKVIKWFSGGHNKNTVSKSIAIAQIKEYMKTHK
jgi:hypothetical protein